MNPLAYYLALNALDQQRRQKQAARSRAGRMTAAQTPRPRAARPFLARLARAW